MPGCVRQAETPVLSSGPERTAWGLGVGRPPGVAVKSGERMPVRGSSLRLCLLREGALLRVRVLWMKASTGPETLRRKYVPESRWSVVFRYRLCCAQCRGLSCRREKKAVQLKVGVLLWEPDGVAAVSWS